MRTSQSDANRVAKVEVTESCLGSGAFGAVYMGFDGATGRPVAVKEIPISREETGDDADKPAPGGGKPDGGVPQQVVNEIAIMRAATHPRLVEYLGARVAHSERSGPVVQIVMEYVAGGSVAKVVRRCGALSESVAALYLRDVLEGIAFLHDKCHVCHRDVKSENILLTPDGRCKVADYGASRTLQAVAGGGPSAMLTSCVGTPHYMAPEVVRNEPYGRRADIWSIGCVMFELLTGKPPQYGAGNPMALLYRVASSDDAVPTLPASGFSADAADFLAHCCRREADERWTAAALLEHPWIRAVARDEQAASAAAAGSGHSQASPTGSSSAAASTVQRKASVHSALADEEEDDAPTADVPHCHLCETGIALFACDECRALGLACQLCPGCWDRSHRRAARARAHAKRPLLFGSASSGGSRADPRPGAGAHGLMLRDGAFVDVVDAAELDWTCALCATPNRAADRECFACSAGRDGAG